MIGLTEAANALEAARELLDADTLTATFHTAHGEMKLTIGRSGGLEVLCDGEPVPMWSRA